jgi:hypothetical protein
MTKQSLLWASGLAFLATLAASWSGSTHAADFDLTNDYGEPGLLQTPSGRMLDEGEFVLGISATRPYNQIHATLQPLPWFAATLRYTDVRNLLYGPESFSGDQTYKDRSFDVRLRLLDEGEYWPAVALGFRDIEGSALFGSQYLALSRRFYDLDLTAGVARGRLGSRGGSVGDESVGPFAGVQWHTPLNGLYLQVEYDGNDYQDEPKGTQLEARTPVNVGLQYRPWKFLSAGVGYERGDIFTFRISLRTNFQRDKGPPKVFDPEPPRLRYEGRRGEPAPEVTAAPATLAPAQRDQFKAALATALDAQGFELEALNIDDRHARAEVWFSQGLYLSEPKAVGRVGRAVAATAPPEIRSIAVINTSGGVETYRVTLDRADLVRAAAFSGDADAVKDSALFSAAAPGWRGAEYPGLGSRPDFSWTTGPALRQHIGGPDAFYFGQLWWYLGADLRLTRHWNLSAAGGFNIYDNFDELKTPSNSELPHVRSDIAQYLNEGKNNLVRLETNYVWSLAKNWYARLSLGLFEEMYGGVAGEILYRPFASRWAVGLDVNRVRQREFDQRFEFRDYEVTTGFLNMYYRLPIYGIVAKLSVGQYLAGDRGATLDLSRRFANGVVAGIFATKTDVSAEEFGEGDFDKGVYISLPLDLFLSQSTRMRAPILFRPLTRDGGQMVRDGQALYPLTEGTDSGSLSENWDDILN